jgi:hypothetical protein
MIWKVLCYPGFGPQWRATPEKPAVLYAEAASADEAKALARNECAQHVYEAFQCFGCETAGLADVPPGSDLIVARTEYGEDEDHRIVVPAENPPDNSGKEPLPDVCLTKITERIKKSLAGGGQDITGL